MKLFFFLRVEMSIVSLKIIKSKKQTQFKNYEKAKANTRTPNLRQGGGGGGGHSFITEMTVFTRETDYSYETGYSFHNSRQIGNTS